MKHFLSALFAIVFFAHTAMAQTFAIKGKLIDKSSGEGLPGASVVVKNETTNTGGLTEVNGTFKVENLKPGTYSVTASYLGYLPHSETVVISGKDAFVTFRLGEDNATLNEVEIVADIAKERETPVAFSAVKEATIKESLAGRDLPMILNETPGVYATQTGGGTGDSRISIRGFSQDNVAVMVNGVPVNDMENGSVYWSNWDLGDVTKSTQVQRGLSASKLATPSVGGTLNILTKGFESKRSVVARQEIGSNKYSKTSLMYSSGKLADDWSFTLYGSRRKSDGWVQGTFDDAYTYFANVSKKIGNHTISLTGLGSPQVHGQRPFAKKIITYDADKAKEMGSTSNEASYGFDYNEFYGNLDRYKISGNDTIHDRGTLNSRQNYYHKPQFNLNHFWTISDKLFMSNVVYASIGNGGGVQPLGNIGTVNGRPNFQAVYDANYSNRDSVSIGALLRSNVNNHRWYGFVSGLDYRATDRTTISVGIDGRTYKGEHYSTIYDLLGADFTNNNTATGNNNVDPATILKKGDKFGFNYNGYVKQIGGFAMAEYKTNVISAFVSSTLYQMSYRREDFFLPKIYSVNGQDKAIPFTTIPNKFLPTQQVNGVYYTQSDYVVSGKDTVQLNQNSPVTVGTGSSKKNIQQVSGEGRLQEQDWVSRQGYSIKGGLNYNLNEYNNVFFNLGYLNKTPFLKFIFDTRSGEKIKDPHNEGVLSFEAGYGINRGSFKANLNAYHTTWKNRSLSATGKGQDENGMDVSVIYNISGMDARHVGVELDLAQEISRKVELNAAISLGDWRWNSTGTARVITSDNIDLGTVTFNAKGVHVGGSAQNQFMVGLRYEPIQGFYIRPTFLLFAKNYADFSPEKLNSNNSQDAYRLPTSRNVDLHTGYSFKFYKDYKFTLNGSILNVLNQFYITDAPIGAGNVNQFDPNAIEVFFNRGRTFTLGASVSF